MSDLISRADTLAKIKEYCIDGDSVVHKWFDTMGIEEVINTMPSVSAERVGVWLHKEMWNDVLDKNISYIECSECGHAPYYGGATETPNYCPNCGAKMKGDINP